MKFAFEDNVIVTSGFYKNFTGTVVKHKEVKNDISYNVKMNHVELKKQDLWFKEEELKKHVTLRNMFNM